MSHGAKRAQDQYRAWDLDDECHGDAELEYQWVKLTEVPCDGCWDALCRKVILQSCEMQPCGVVACDFDHAAHDHELEEQESEHPQHHAWRLAAAQRSSIQRRV